MIKRGIKMITYKLIALWVMIGSLPFGLWVVIDHAIKMRAEKK